MFHKIVSSALICSFLAAICFAQSSDDYKKKEFFVGYSAQRSNGSTANGFEVSGVRNFSRYFGVKGDFSGAFRRQTSNGSISSGGTITQFSTRSNDQSYNFLGGVQVKDNRTEGHFKPFANALVGVGYGRFKNRLTNCSNAATCNNLFF